MYKNFMTKNIELAPIIIISNLIMAGIFQSYLWGVCFGLSLVYAAYNQHIKSKQDSRLEAVLSQVAELKEQVVALNIRGSLGR